MTDLETTLRRGLEAFDAETAAAATPDLTAIRPQAGAPTRTLRQWPKIAIVIATGAVVTSGAAAAVGVLPLPVEATLREFRSWGYPANGGAERMAWTTDDGLTYEVWLAPLDGGGQCSSVRVIGPAGDVEHGGGSSCDPDAPAPNTADEFDDLWYPERVWDNSTGRQPGAHQHATASGRAPANATRVIFEFEGGSSLTLEPQHDGYFVTTFPGVADGTRITTVQAVDGTGQAIATRAL